MRPTTNSRSTSARHPETSAYWSPPISAQARNRPGSISSTRQVAPDVAVTAIVKPLPVDTNGIVTAADADLSTNITDFTASANHSHCVSTISGSGTRPVADIKAIIDSYISYYPSLGFFLDEMGTGTSQRPFYSDIYTYIKGLAPTMSHRQPWNIPRFVLRRASDGRRCGHV
ncbi:MAG: spherulation-specific family 4 protein [Burkholderiaceae bacterium]